MLKHVTSVFKNWTNLTKPVNSYKDEFGFNITENRLEFYIVDLEKWFYLWSEYVAITEQPTAPYFSENFESDWFVSNQFIKIYEEFFEDGWFVDNIFNFIFAENFEIGW